MFTGAYSLKNSMLESEIDEKEKVIREQDRRVTELTEVEKRYERFLESLPPEVAEQIGVTAKPGRRGRRPQR